jgi:MFS family permease
MTFRSMHRQVLLLASAQALFQTASVLVMTVGGLAGGMLAPSPDLATLPIAAMFLGTAATTFPASMWMARAGRRAGFVVGALLGAAGGLLAAAGIWLDAFPLLVAGTCLVGAHQAFAQFYRFAASEVADDSFRPRAIAWVLGGGIVAAFAGPTLARYGSHLFGPDFFGSFLLLTAVTASGAVLLGALNIPKPSPLVPLETGGRPWLTIVGQKEYLVALFGAATGYGMMILAMTATPIAMMQHHHELSSAATVIQFHVLGMFLPSFFTGSLITRFGVLRIMGTGVLLFVGHVLMTLTGFGFGSFALELILVGMGWNFLYIGGTTLLTTTYTPAEKGRAQATNDMTIFAVGLICSFSAAGLLQALGWQTLNFLLLPWLALAMTALLWLGLRQRRLVEPAAASW